MSVCILDPSTKGIVKSECIGVKGHFGGRSMNVYYEKGAVFAEDGDIVIYDDFSCNFIKTSF